MKAYHVGIDFGTSQTKICIKNIENNSYFFHRFNFNNSYFLPSSIKVDTDEFCSIGSDKLGQIRFFKMAALHDEQFDKIFHNNNIQGQIVYTKTALDKIDSNPRSQDELEKFPELCCIIYLAQIISELQESLQHVENINTTEELDPSENVSEETVLNLENNQSSFDKLLSIFKKKSTSQITSKPLAKEIEAQQKKELRVTKAKLLLTIGIPTEYDNNYNILRRHKMYQMLLMAKRLSDKIDTTEKFGNTTVSELVEEIKTIFEDSIKGMSFSELEKLYNDEGIFVIAETTAGIEPIRNDRKRMLSEIINNGGNDWYNEYAAFRENHSGCYMTMDIGAGTTDISFFQMITFDNGEIKIKYYSSQPIPYASNQIISKYLNSMDFDEISNFDFSNTSTEEWTNSQLGSRADLYKVINGYDTPNPEQSVFGRVRSTFIKHRLLLGNHWHYEDPPPHRIAKGCFVYGGGSRFNEFGNGDLLLQHVAFNNEIYTRIKKLVQGNEIISNLNLSQKNGYPLEQNDIQDIIISFDMLIVALGLAMLSPGNRDDTWINIDEYLPDMNSVKIDTNRPIFDLFRRRWI